VISGVGIDLVEIERLENALDRRPQLAGRLFTEAELAYAAEQARPGRHLAARFAAKEAVIKALALRDGAPMRQIEVIPGVPPSLRLTGRAGEAAGSRRLHLSLTHTDVHASAVVVAEA
jgi:holo-[acyl-carrier protein] synthase